jgi:prepilin-type N-terminal cleavage/methylation domain-containing protein
MRRSIRTGFSLIELLIVLAIITVLIGILVPAVGRFRRAAEVTQCASNLRQIGQALFMYRTANRAWPDATSIPAPFTEPNQPANPTLPDRLAPYLSPATSVYHCPGDFQQVYTPQSFLAACPKGRVGFARLIFSARPFGHAAKKAHRIPHSFRHSRFHHS